jgi:hypothetical protein
LEGNGDARSQIGEEGMVVVVFWRKRVWDKAMDGVGRVQYINRS